MSKRKIIKIDEEKCTGCGKCVISCAEGALKIVDGKAKLVSETYCDGLGACIGECPEGALLIEERESEEFDEKAVEQHLSKNESKRQETSCSCPSIAPKEFEKVRVAQTPARGRSIPELTHWPVQLRLVPPAAPFLQKANLVLVADCVPFAYADFHPDFVKGHVILVACPKLDDFGAHLTKLVEIIRTANLTSLTVLHMEVPCCSGLVHMAKQALEASGVKIPFKDITISVRGECLATK